MADGHAVTLLFLTLAVAYLAVMMFGAFTIRVPAEGWTPDGWDPSQVKEKSMVTTASVSAANAIRTPQFYLLWVVLFCNVTAGIGILEQAAPMIQDFFREGSTSSVTAAAAGGFVGLLSLANMGGRFLWSSTSDVIGRKPIYMLYLGGGMVLYLFLALSGNVATALFVLVAALIISFYGGGFATVPAYLRDLFGTYQVGAIHGRLLTAWSAAGVAGPLIVNAFLDAQGTPGELTAAAYRPALLTMVGRARGRLRREPAGPSRQREVPRARALEGGGGSGMTARIVVAWAVVGIPLTYGLVETIRKASTLFTG